MQIDFSALEQQLAEWKSHHIQHVRETFCEEWAADTERLFKEEPWTALKWFVEDKVGHEPPVSAEEQLAPEYRELEIDGQPVLCGNVDAALEMISGIDSPETVALSRAYHEALAELSAANGGAQSEFVRQEAFQIALGQCGFALELSGNDQGSSVQ